jgi:hypothetical protein
MVQGSDGGRQHCYLVRRKETASFGLSGPAIGPQAESFWAGVMEIKGKRFRAAKRGWAKNRAG